MGKMIVDLTAILVIVLLVSSGLMEKGEAQAEGCEWECKGLPNFKCWLDQAGHKLCDDFCKSEGALSGFCVSNATSNSHHCFCRKAGCDPS